MISLETLMPRVLQYAPNCPEPAVLLHMVDAARTVCERTAAWQEELVLTVTTPARVDLTEGLDDDWSAEIIDVLSAALDDYPLEPQTVADLDAMYPAWNRTTDTGTASYFTQLEMDTLSLVPRQEGELKARVSLKPALTADEIPDILYRKYGLLIAKGAAGEVLGIPNTEYANPALAGVLRSEFANALPSAARKARKGQQRAPLRTKPRFL